MYDYWAYGCFWWKNTKSNFFIPHASVFLLAGYTIKEIPLNAILTTTKKDFIRLIVPVFIMRGVNLAVSVVFKNVSFSRSLWENIRPILWGNGNDYGPISFSTPIQMYGVGVLWFLIALFWAKLLYRIFDSTVKKHRFIILLVFSFFGMWIGSIFRLPHCIDMMPLIMFFMECGKYLKVNIDMNSSLWTKIGIISFFTWIHLVWNKGIYIEMATRQYPYSMLSVFIAVLGCVVVVQFSQGLEQFKYKKVISFLGRNSLDMLCIHHIDGYLSSVWEIAIFAEDSKMFFVNEVATSIARVVIDVVILYGWLALKNIILKIMKKNKFSVLV